MKKEKSHYDSDKYDDADQYESNGREFRRLREDKHARKKKSRRAGGKDTYKKKKIRDDAE